MEVLGISGRVSRGIPNCSISDMNQSNDLVSHNGKDKLTDSTLKVICSELSLEVLEIFESCDLWETDDWGNQSLKEEHQDDFNMLYDTFEFSVKSILNGNLVNPKPIDMNTWRLTHE